MKVFIENLVKRHTPGEQETELPENTSICFVTKRGVITISCDDELGAINVRKIGTVNDQLEIMPNGNNSVIIR